ncbi:MAG: ATP-grasp domain-containing protein, partial [Caldimonas sp.]
MSVFIVAGLSARMLAETAADEGFDVVALDLFGDADTRRASVDWHAIGNPSSLRIDAEMFLDALRVAAAAHADVLGWIAGSGFEGRPDLLQRGAQVMRRIGNDADTVARVRDPQSFFAVLEAARVPHPPVRFSAPSGKGWLLKDAHGCGGWHVRRVEAPPDRSLSAADADAPAHHYFQREVDGIPMSATFVADGRHARVLGFNEQIVKPVGRHPFGYHGAVGPVPMQAALAARVTAAVEAVVAAFELRGLGSLDFMLQG